MRSLQGTENPRLCESAVTIHGWIPDLVEEMIHAPLDRTTTPLRVSLQIPPARHTFGDVDAAAEGEHQLQGAGADSGAPGAGAVAAGGEEAGVMSITGIVDRLDRYVTERDRDT